MFLHVPVKGCLLPTSKSTDLALERLLAGVNHPVHCQVVGTLEGSSTILTDIISLICMMFGMSEKLLLEPKESSTGGMGTYIFLLQQMLVFNVVLQVARVSKDGPAAFHLTADVLDGGFFLLWVIVGFCHLFAFFLSS